MSNSNKTKILIASGSRHSIPPLKHSPGVARIIYTLANHLDQDNYDVRVISKYHKELEHIGFDKNIYLHPQPNIRTRLLQPVLNQLPYSLVKKWYGFTQIDRILYYTGIVDLAKKQKPDIVVTFMHFELFKMLHKAIPHNKHIFFFRSTDLADRVGNNNMDYLIKYSSGFLANTEASIKELNEFGNIPFPTQTIYNSISKLTRSNSELVSARNKTRYKFKIDEDALVIGFAGRFSKEKSLLELFKAVKAQRDLGFNYQILIAGDINNEKTPSLSYYQKLKAFEKAHLENAVHWMGWVTHSDLYRFYTAIDFSVVLSKYREGNSMFLLESLSYGKPVIATSIGGNVEVIDDKENGFLIDHNYIEDGLSSVFGYINAKNNHYKIWGSNAIEYVMKNHSEQNMVTLFTSFIESVNS